MGKREKERKCVCAEKEWLSPEFLHKINFWGKHEIMCPAKKLQGVHDDRRSRSGRHKHEEGVVLFVERKSKG